MSQMQESGGDYSEMTAHLIDNEIRQIIDEQYDRALKILQSVRNLLVSAAEKLLENEVIEGADLKALSDAVSSHRDAQRDFQESDNDRSLAA
jgi:ATP-dependent Zn protease